ncbi:type II toxin-antitoxin system HicA family toxin [Klebsiella michiganensis]
MNHIRKLARGNGALAALLEYAHTLGWQASRTSGGHLRFCKPGCTPVYTSSTPGDHRAFRNARAMLKRRSGGGE